MGKEGKPGKGLASCNYGASATPTLSPIIRVRFEVRFSGPLRAKRRARATARHRDPNVHVNPLKKQETKSSRGVLGGKRLFGVSVCTDWSIIWRLASDTNRFGTFRFSGLCAFSRTARPQGMRLIRREGLMHDYFRDRRSDTTDAITVEGGRVVMRVRSKPLKMNFYHRIRSVCCTLDTFV